MTIAELEERLSPIELYEWMAFYKMKAEDEKKAADKAKRGSKRK